MIGVEIAGHILFWLVMLVGIIIIPVGLPGTFVILLNALAFAFLTHFAEITWGALAWLLVIALVAEAIEFFVGAATTGKFGGSRPAMFGAILGGFFGAIWATPIFPILGTILGAFAGAFAGAALFEYFVTRDINKALRVGYGAFLGTLGGKLSKIAAAIAMVVLVGFRIY